MRLINKAIVHFKKRTTPLGFITGLYKTALKYLKYKIKKINTQSIIIIGTKT